MKIILFELIFISICNSQIPKECGHNFTLKTGTCCPKGGNDLNPCGFPIKGECLTVEINESPSSWGNKKDSRMLWPKYWFNRLCHCKNNFYGPSCTDCFYGYQGENCSEKHLVVRRNILSYNSREKEILVEVLAAMRHEYLDYLIVDEAYKHNSESVRLGNMHELIVNIHFLAQRSLIKSNRRDCRDSPVYNLNHKNTGFLTWHRHFMLLWEKWARNIAKKMFNIEDFSFPYWDWVDKTSCEICTNDLIGSEGEVSDNDSFYLNTKSKFSNWKVYCNIFDPKYHIHGNLCSPCSNSKQSERLSRRFITGRFPTKYHVSFALSQKKFGSKFRKSQPPCEDFSLVLEGYCSLPEWHLSRSMHNFVHSDVIGSFADSSTSTNDPLFIFHHIQIDRIFQAWWEKSLDEDKVYPNISYPGHCFKCNQVGFIPAITHEKFFVDSANLGYRYDSFLFGNEN